MCAVCLQLTLQLLAGKAAPASTAGLLADTLHLLAAGLEDAPQRTRKALSLKLLLLFSDVAALVGGSSGIVRADLGDLLVAVAVAAEGLQNTIRLLGGSSSSNNSLTRMSLHDIQSAQREGASTTRLFRSLWLHTAMQKLVSPAAGTNAAAGGSLPAGDVQWEWQSAAGRLAAVTPLLMVGTNSYFEGDMVERLKVRMAALAPLSFSLGSRGCWWAWCKSVQLADFSCFALCMQQKGQSRDSFAAEHALAPHLRQEEFLSEPVHVPAWSLPAAAQIELGEQLVQAGSLGSASSLTSVLVGLLGGKHSLNGQALPQPSEGALVGLIVAIAMAELSRAALAPLPDLGEAAMHDACAAGHPTADARP